MSNMMSVQYSRLPSQGVVYGLSGVALVSLSAAGGVLGVAAMSRGLFGVLLTAPVWILLAVLGVVKRHGEALATHTGRELVGYGRKALGMTTYRARPEKRTVTELGVMSLPGREGRFHLWETSQGELAVWDARAQTITVSCLVATNGLSLASAEEVNQRVAAWANVQGSWTQRAHVKRVMVIEQSRPGTVAAEQRDYDERARSGSDAVHVAYREALRLAGESVVMHRTQIVFTLDTSGSEAKALVKAQGGGKPGVLSLAELEMEAATGALRSAGFQRVHWVRPREWAAWGRGMIDPLSQASIDLRIGTDFDGVDPQAAGPMFVKDESTWVETDSAFHRTFWIHEWPRTETYPGFLDSLVFAADRSGAPVRHTFALITTPEPLADALDRVEQEKRTWITNQNIKAKVGRPQNAADEADWANIIEHERALVAGQGELNYSAYVTVTALDREELERATATIRNACSMARLELQLLRWQQAEAFMNIAYPTGLGMK